MRFTIWAKIICSASAMLITAFIIGIFSVVSSNSAKSDAADIENIFVKISAVNMDITRDVLVVIRDVRSFTASKKASDEESAKLNMKLLDESIKNMDILLNAPGVSIMIPKTYEYFIKFKERLNNYISLSTKSMGETNSIVKSSTLVVDLIGQSIKTCEEASAYNIQHTETAEDIATIRRNIKLTMLAEALTKNSNIMLTSFYKYLNDSDVKHINIIKDMAKRNDKLVEEFQSITVAKENREFAANLVRLAAEIDKSVDEVLKIADGFTATDKARYAAVEEMTVMTGEMSDIINSMVVRNVGLVVKQLSNSMNVSIIMLIIFILVAIIILIVMDRSIRKPINQFIMAVSNLTSGDGDLTKRISSKMNDELHDLSIYFNQFIGNIQEIISDVKSAAEEVASGNNQLAATMEELSTTFDSQAKQVSEIVERMETVGNVSKAAVDGIMLNVTSMTETSDLTKSGSSQLGVVKNSMEDIKKQTVSLSHTIERLSESSVQIGEILTVINDIANQTNLLALNAAIEAARAGDAGRGFAVVADEVRKLAERTQKATGEIETIIGSLQKESSQASTEMEKAAETVQGGVENIATTSGGFLTVVSSVAVMKTEMEKLAGYAKEQYRTVQVVGDNTQVIASGIEESSAAVNEVATTVSHLQTRAEELKNLVSKFKI